MEERTKGRVGEGGVWSCKDCFAVHRSDVVAAVVDALMSGETISEAWKKVESLL
jgi:Zn-finger protein